jgi:ribonuclease BN (tRNA processing enzyme)
MSPRVTFVGSGDAFGSGGRAQTCFHVSDGAHSLLVDCGATSLPALRRLGLASPALDLVVVSHLHGDHFAGVPFLLLEAAYLTPRTHPLAIAGPPGIEARVMGVLDLLFPGAGARVRERVPVEFIDYDVGVEQPLGHVRLLPLEVVHPSGAPSCGLRLSWGDRVLAYSGDTEWTDALVALAAGADLFVCECSTYDKAVPYHLSYATLQARRAELAARRIVLTHMSDSMLARAGEVDLACAHDGLVVEL